MKINLISRICALFPVLLNAKMHSMEHQKKQPSMSGEVYILPLFVSD